MAKAKTEKAKSIPAQPKTISFTEVFDFHSEKKTSWRYDLATSDFSTSVFLKKRRWPNKPGDKIKVTFQVEGDA